MTCALSLFASLAPRAPGQQLRYREPVRKISRDRATEHTMNLARRLEHRSGNVALPLDHYGNQRCAIENQKGSAFAIEDRQRERHQSFRKLTDIARVTPLSGFGYLAAQGVFI